MRWMLIFSTLIVGVAQAGGYRHVTNNYITNNYTTIIDETYIEEGEVSQSEHDATAAQGFATDQIHCSTSVRKHQMGFGIGHRGGKNAAALGYCKTFVSEGGTTYMLGGSTAVADDVKPGVGVGINWTF